MSSSSSGQGQADKKPGIPKPGGKLLRLRGRSRPLHETAIAGIDQEDGPDVWFVCSGGKIVGGHKIILGITSKFFATVMQDQNPADQTVIHVPDVPVEVMQVILSLMYRDNVNVPLEVMTGISDFMSLFGMGLEKFIVGEAKENAQPLQNRVYDYVPSRDKAVRDERVQEDGNNKKNTVPSSSSNTSTATSSPKNSKKQSNGLPSIVPVAVPTAPAPAQPLQLVNYGGKYYTMQPSQDPKMPAQLHLLDPQPIINTVSVPIPAEASPVANNLAVGQDAKKPRLILPKPSGGSLGVPAGNVMKTPNLRPITASELLKRKAEEAAQREAAGGPPVLERMTNTDEENAIEMDADEDHVADPSDVQEKYADWWANVGKSSTSPSPTPPKLMKVTPLKRPGSEMASMLTPEKGVRSKCRICGITFDTMNKLKWHTDRHSGPGVFKCPKCPGMFKSARAVHEHETASHPPVVKKPNSLQHPAAESSTCYKSSLHRAVGMSSASSAILHKRNAMSSFKFQKRLQRYRSASGPRQIQQKKSTAPNPNPLIAVGKGPGEESIEPQILKKLHWLYVCNKCEHCIDSSAKAVAHHKACYPDQTESFEETIVKYRQGFYGKVECPLCPRRYPTLSGFLCHCGQVHGSYRRTFSHLTFDDLLMCQTCREKFPSPQEFHAHLNKNQRCDKGPYGYQGAEADAGPVVSNVESVEELRQRSYAKLLGKNPRSARLQNKLAVVTGTTQEVETNEVNEEELEPVTCPVCDEDNVKLLTEHLSEVHEDLEANVERTEAANLKCKDCGITFAICDLITHVQSCTQSKGSGYARCHRRYAPKPPAAKPKAPAPVLHYPEGIGKSPVDQMENADLMDRALVREAVKCSVCDKVGRQMSKITACLKTHGIYRCAICFNTYLSKDDYTTHVKIVHGVPHSSRWACPLCDVTRANVGQLTSHMHRDHWGGMIKEIILDVKAEKRATRAPDDEYETAGESDGEFLDSFGRTGGETESEDDDIVEKSVPSKQAMEVANEAETLILGKDIGERRKSYGTGMKDQSLNVAPGTSSAAATNGPGSTQTIEFVASNDSNTLQETESKTVGDAVASPPRPKVARSPIKMEIDEQSTETVSESTATKGASS